MTGEAKLIVHGGAGTIAPELRHDVQAGIRAATLCGQELLRTGASAVEIAVAVVRVLEDHPAFNAGRGSCLTESGEVEVDAGIMRSEDLRSGAIAGVKNCRGAIHIARAVMEKTRHALLVGPGAEAFAREHGVGFFGADEVESVKARERWRGAVAGELSIDNRADTVGAVVLDPRGHLCAAGSTGGVLLKLPGRAGDTPLVGSGFFAHPQLGACCCTGVGEAIMAKVLAYEALRQVDAAPERAQTIADQLCRTTSVEHGGAAVGLILLRPDGRSILAHHSDHMSWGVAQAEGDARSGLALRG